LAELAAGLCRSRHQGGQGLWVFPVAANKVPCCAHGHKDAVDRPDRAYEFFMRHPGARLVGVAMGVRSMLLGLDVDPAGLGWYRENFARFPVTTSFAFFTPRGDRGSDEIGN
jgi:hypothetical protein